MKPLKLLSPILVLLLAACAGSGSKSLSCSHPAKGYYCVKSGDTLYRISQRFNISVPTLRALNGLDNDRILVGQTLQISHNTGSHPAASSPPPRQSADNGRIRMQWPVEGGSLIKPYGRDNRGIDIAAPAGTPVKAAAPGVVIYTGEAVRGYGKLIVIRHRGNVITAYANNDSILISEQARVGSGQRIATVGSTGRSDGETALHFEVRINSRHVDPALYLK